MLTKYKMAIETLQKGLDFKMTLIGPSMRPLIESGSHATFRATNDYQVGDVVMTKVKGRWMVHKITKIGSDGRYMISNNHGHDNGWTKQVYARVIKVNESPFGRKIRETK